MATKFFHYNLKLQSPLLISSISGNPNNVDAQTKIPGSAIRGLIAGVIGDAHALFDDLILNGKVRYLNAYLASESNNATRSLPAPLSWQCIKGDDQQIFDCAVQSDERAGRGEQRVRNAQQFVIYGSGKVTAVSATVLTTFHHQRDRIAGRATKNSGAIFSYEALAAGTMLAGAISISASEEEVDTLFNCISKSLSGELMMGRSHNSQYGGRMLLSWTGGGLPAAREVSGSWADLKDVVRKGEHLRLWLTSDAIIRNSFTGQIDSTCLYSALDNLMPGKFELVSQFTGSTIASGFNRKWRLAVPQSHAIAGGSVLVLKVLDDLQFADLMALEQAGLGERKIEGYGAFIFTPLGAHRLLIGKGDRQSTNIKQPSSQNTPETEFLQKRLFRAATESVVRRHVTNLVNLKTGRESIPSPSLLGRLLVPVRSHAAGIKEIHQWVDDSDGNNSRLKKPALKQLQRCKLGNSEFLDEWLKDTTDEGKNCALAEWLFKDDESLERLSLRGQVEQNEREMLAGESRRLLVKVLLETLMKQAKQGKE